jgi:hypothetical protein
MLNEELIKILQGLPKKADVRIHGITFDKHCGNSWDSDWLDIDPSDIGLKEDNTIILIEGIGK